MARSSVGLYLGVESADLVVLTGTFQHPRVAHFGKVALPGESAWTTQIRAEEKGPSPSSEEGSMGEAAVQEELAQSLETLLAKNGLSSPKAFTAVSSEAIVVRYFQMPTLPLHERPLAVSFEAKRYLPFKLDELVTDYQAVIQRSDPTLMRVIFAGIKKGSLATLLSLFKAADLTPLCLEPVPISLMRLLRHSGRLSPGQVAAILYVERDTATIGIARDNLLYLSRNAVIFPTAESPQGPSAELLGALINETRVSIDYYRRRFLGEEGVSKIILFGQQLSPPRIDELRNSLGLPVERGDSFERISGGREIPANLAVATGVALRGLEGKGGGINLLPPEYRLRFQGLLKPVLAEAAALLALLGIWFAFSTADLDRWEGRISVLRQDQASPAGIPPQAGLEELKRIQKEQGLQLQFLGDLSKTRGTATALLSETGGPLPSANHSRILKLAGGVYTRDGNKELQQINHLLTSLKANPFFKSAFKEIQLERVQRARFQQEEFTEFHLACTAEASGP
ncbi:MAG: pilus assembly protein PilM [Candidatus Omnitrophica bacterium]|nr:pilus assembly protein PilM [Candidatus Omnitrophota bacterium]